MAASKNIVFDVVGTLVSFEHLFEAIEERLGTKLRAEGIQPKLLGCSWLEVAEREYTYLSISGRYVVFFKVFEALFYRCLHYAGIENPRSFASPDDVAFLIDEWKKLRLREGAAECVSKLREAGFTVGVSQRETLPVWEATFRKRVSTCQLRIYYHVTRQG